MAANYWASTQRRHWQFSRESLNEVRQQLEDEEKTIVQQYPLPDRRLLSIFFNLQLVKLGKRLNVRQQALATAQVYVRRFYSKVEIRRTNPYLVMATAFYLACKMEECPQHIRSIVTEARIAWPEYIASDISKIGECEFYLISEMNSQLIVHHPYRTLHEFQDKLKMAQDDISLAWSIINDHYLTDLPLLGAPHIIAVTAIFLAVTLKPTQTGLQAAASAVAGLNSATSGTNDSAGTGSGTPNTQQKKVQYLVSWLAQGEIDIKAVVECSQEIISLYDVWEQYNEKTCREQIARFVKARGLDK